MKEKVEAAVSLDSSAERVSAGLFSLTSAVDMVMVCGGVGKKQGVNEINTLHFPRGRGRRPFSV